MRFIVVVSAFVLAAGCATTRPAETVMDENKFQETYGNVPIIQLGMSMNDVDRLVRCSGKTEMQTGSNVAVTTWLHACGLIIEESASGKVAGCWCSADITLPGPAPKQFIDDSVLAAMLQTGLAPSEVEEKIGKASCGFSNTPGKVHLWYQKHGIEVVFDKEKLLKWRRVITYRYARGH